MSNKITKIGIILLSLILITSVLTSVYAADVTETQFADFTFKHSDDLQRTDSQSQDTHGMTFKDKNNTMYTIRDDSGAIPSSYHSSSKDIKIGNWTVNEIKLDAPIITNFIKLEVERPMQNVPAAIFQINIE